MQLSTWTLPFASTLQKTDAWLSEFAGELTIQDPKRARRTFAVALHALRDRLPVNESAHFAAQLPLLLRGLYFEGWSPAGQPEKLSREEFIQRVRSELLDDDPNAEEAVSALFLVCSRHISEGELADLRAALPEDFAQYLHVGVTDR